MSTITTTTSTNDADETTATTLYEDDDVVRYDADPYHKKYGDKWKQYATRVRDVPQEDGSIIREYVIEDPSVFDDLSEQEDERYQSRSSHVRPSQSVTNTQHQQQQYQQQVQSPTRIIKSESVQIPKPPPVSVNLAPSSSLQQYGRANSNQPSTVNIVKSGKNPQLQNFKNLAQRSQSDRDNNMRKLSSDSADKEMEAIQEEHKKLTNSSQSSKDNETGSETIVEYEILDENGNLIKLEGAEQLKHLASFVKHVQESDGSIVKEYILNDPKVIEKIKNQVKEKQLAQQSKGVPTSSSSSSSSASISMSTTHPQSKHYDRQPVASQATAQQRMPINGNNKTPPNLQAYKLPPHLQMVRLSKISGGSNEAIEQQANRLAASARTVDDFQRRQQQTQQNGYSGQIQNQTKSESELRQIDFNKYEIITSSGKAIQFTITNGNASSSDVKEIKNAIENRILPTLEHQLQPQHQSQPVYSPSLAQSAKQNLKINKSCDNLFSLNDDDSQSAFINYKNTNGSQASLAKLKDHIASPRHNSTTNGFKRSMSLGNLDDISNDTQIQQPHAEQQQQQQKPSPSSNEAITPEMTEHLILKLLLQQLVSSSDQNPPDLQHNPQLQALQMQRQRLQLMNQQQQAAVNRQQRMYEDKQQQQQQLPAAPSTTQTFFPAPQYHHPVNDPYYRPYYPNNNYSLLINRPLNAADQYAAAAYRYNNNIYRK